MVRSVQFFAHVCPFGHQILEIFVQFCNFFAFCNRKRNLVKILYWQKNGFCIWLKRLEGDVFRWPDSEEEVMEINREALGWLLHGLDLSNAHQRLAYTSVS